MSVAKLIKQLVKFDPTLADDDDKLTAAIWKHYGIEVSPALLKKLPDQQHIKRQRRILHEKGKIKYSPQVEQLRFKQFKQKQAEYSKKSFKWLQNKDGSMRKVEL